jgi:hypothetical protein
MEIYKKFRIFVVMIPISLPNGKVVFITFEESLDEDFLQNLIAKDEGYEIDNPFDSQLDRIRDSWEVTELPKKEVKRIQNQIRYERDQKA